jgi:FPC/CPF motif-containing protein YcgG
MSENKIEVMPLDAIVDIKVNGAFLTRVQACLMYLLKDKTQEELQAASEAIKAQTHTQDWEFHYETLGILINDIERAAKESNVTVFKTPEELQADIQGAIETEVAGESDVATPESEG